MSEHSAQDAASRGDPSAILPALSLSPIDNPQQHLSRPPETHRVKRDGLVDLTFLGWRLGYGCVESGGYTGATSDDRTNRGIIVEIFVSDKGKFVVRIERWADHGKVKRSAIHTATSVRDLYSTLVDAGNGKLGSASRDAWNEACEAFTPMKSSATETLE